LPGDDLVADCHGDAFWLKVGVDGPRVGPDLHDDLVAGRLGAIDPRRQRVGWLLREAVAHRDNRAGRCSDNAGAMAEPLEQRFEEASGSAPHRDVVESRDARTARRLVQTHAETYAALGERVAVDVVDEQLAVHLERQVHARAVALVAAFGRQPVRAADVERQRRPLQLLIPRRM
jgi:hypothetical protein